MNAETKRILAFISASLFVTFMLLSIVAYTRDPIREEDRLMGMVVQTAAFTHEGHFTNSTVYGERASLKNYPTGITDAIYGRYTYTVSPVLTGRYELQGIVTYFVTKGGERIVLFNETLFKYSGAFEDGGFTRVVYFNLTKIDERRDELAKALKLPRLSREISMKAFVQASDEEFAHEITLVRDSSTGLTSVANAEKVVRKNIVDRMSIKNELLFMSVSTARIVFPLLAIASGLMFLWLWDPKPRKRGTLEGRPHGIEAKVFLNDEKSLKKVANLTGNPIFHYRVDGTDVYGVVDGQVIYEYRERARGSGES
ncbi:hypothetical protein [Pyrococcus yayanosii]|uniref:Uncharacterized protein n=1 Tax=Pyrococcus yayanosii (strain CH1 / JCM 16557) TaxID=529709 RepID=F8AF80_PYRYC|nr:hypothetical protein [Pyrococcus yayanosii]AEH24908.1 hypothetical protein PYCH_12300 [Pyrococcus yayanosii CH1]